MRLFKLTSRFLMAATAGLVIFTSCVKNENTNDSFDKIQELKNLNSNLATEWMSLSFELTKKTPGFSSPVAARTFAYLGLGMYEVLVPGMSGYSSMQGKYQDFRKGTMKNPNQFGEISWGVSFNQMMYQLFKRFYRNTTPEGIAEIEKLYQRKIDEFSKSISADVLSNSLNYANDQAEALYSYSVSDGQEEAFLNNYPKNFSAPQGQGVWTPNLSANKKALQPFWGDVRTFVHHDLSDMEMIAPPPFNTDKSSVFYSYALEVRNKSENVNRYDEVMVNFWNDEIDGQITPAGHMLSILCQNALSENKELGFTAFAIMKLATVLHDATVASWKTKFTYYTIRPETYIRLYIDQDFLSLTSPNSTPEYSSGQAATAAAAAEVMGSLFGYNYGFTDRTYEGRKDINGSPRSFQSYQDMSEEILNANLLGGIHYRFSLEAGQKQGIEIARDFNAIR